MSSKQVRGIAGRQLAANAFGMQASKHSIYAEKVMEATP